MRWATAIRPVGFPADLPDNKRKTHRQLESARSRAAAGAGFSLRTVGRSWRRPLEGDFGQILNDLPGFIYKETIKPSGNFIVFKVKGRNRRNRALI
jgi:hypothetical protein